MPAVEEHGAFGIEGRALRKRRDQAASLQPFGSREPDQLEHRRHQVDQLDRPATHESGL